jgi:serine protease Do
MKPPARTRSDSARGIGLLILGLAAWGCSAEAGSLAEAAEANRLAAESAPRPASSEAALRTQSSVGDVVEQSTDLDDSRRTAIVRAANRVAPAVVSIGVIRSERARPRTVWESFFMPPGSQRRSASFGSGVIVDPSGIVLSNDHVVRDAAQIKVTLPDGRDFEGELVGTDPVADIAVLRIRADDLPVAPVGTSEGLMIGEWAVAIGNPFVYYFSDAEPTVTAGVISAVGRNIVPSSDDQGFYLGMIQTDASINPGNSGGPLVNALGEVIGINASIFSRSGGSEGLGCAIPIDRALRIADDLVRLGEIPRPWLGFDVEPVEADEWGRTRGVRVSRVAPDSPADQAAIEGGDRLLAANGRALTAPLDFEAVLLDLRAGDPLELEIEGQRRPITVQSAPLPSVTAERVRVLQDMELTSVTPQIRAERSLASEDGALILSISDRLSGLTGFRGGDVLVQVGSTRIRSAEDAARIFDRLRGPRVVRFWLERNGDYVARDLRWR